MPGFFLDGKQCLLALAWAIYFQTVAHVGVEVLERLVLVALSLEWLGSNLLVAATVTAVQRTHTITLR